MRPLGRGAPPPNVRAKVEVPAWVRVAIIRMGTIALARSRLRVSPELYRELVGANGRVTSAALERVVARLTDLGCSDAGS